MSEHAHALHHIPVRHVLILASRTEFFIEELKNSFF